MRLAGFILMLFVLMLPLSKAQDLVKAPNGGAPNHLEPLAQPQGAYSKRIEEHLFVTSGLLGRFVVRPSFTAERCVAIQADFFPPQDAREFTLTLTEPSESLWYSMPENDIGRLDPDVPPRVPAEITVQRKDRVISRELAFAVQRVWAKMLLETGYPDAAHRGLDGTTYHFSVFVLGLGDLHGETWSPDEGFPAELVALGERLVELARDETLEESPLIADLKDLEARLPETPRTE